MDNITINAITRAICKISPTIAEQMFNEIDDEYAKLFAARNAEIKAKEDFNISQAALREECQKRAAEIRELCQSSSSRYE
jgi:hypothetical protein